MPDPDRPQVWTMLLRSVYDPHTGHHTLEEVTPPTPSHGVDLREVLDPVTGQIHIREAGDP